MKNFAMKRIVVKAPGKIVFEAVDDAPEDIDFVRKLLPSSELVRNAGRTRAVAWVYVHRLGERCDSFQEA
jgi:hypothetical protein